MIWGIHYFITKIKTKIDVSRICFNLKYIQHNVFYCLCQCIAKQLMTKMSVQMSRVAIWTRCQTVPGRARTVHVSNISWLMHRALSYPILIYGHLKLCLAAATHNFKWMKFMWFVKFRSQKYQCFNIKGIFSFNHWLSGIINVLIKTQDVFCGRCSRG